MQTIKSLAAESPELCEHLSQFSFEAVAKLVGSLASDPSFQANSDRLELLLNLAAVSCAGVAHPNLAQFTRIVRKISKTSIAQQEDPPSDVFVAEVSTEAGGFRVFPGSFQSGDFWVKRLFDHLYEKTNFPPFGDIVGRVLALLKLSDAVAARLGLERNSEGNDNTAEWLDLPRWAEIESRGRALVFSSDDLIELGIGTSDIDAFIWTEQHRPGMEDSKLWNSSFDARPLLRTQNGILVSSPTTIARAAVRHMVQSISETGLEQKSMFFYEKEVAEIFVNDVARALRIKKLSSGAPRPSGSVHLWPYFASFDSDKAVILVTMSPDPLKHLGNLDEIDNFPDEFCDTVSVEIEGWITGLEAKGFTSGLVLFCLGGIGRGVSFAIKPANENWIYHLATLPDWVTLADSSTATAMSLYKLGLHQKLLESRNARVMALYGMVDIFAFWELNIYRLFVSDHVLDGRPIMTVLDGSSAREFRAKIRKKRDNHAVIAFDKASWLILERREPTSLFKEDANNNLYGSLSLLREGVLGGCLETDARVWWVQVSNEKLGSEPRDVAYRLWDCITNWLVPLVPVVQGELVSLPDGPLMLWINLEEPDGWTFGTPNELPKPYVDMSVRAVAGERSLTLNFPEGFLAGFNQPKNFAEKKIVSSIVEGLGVLAGSPFSNDRIEQLVNQIVLNEDVRHFHVFMSKEVGWLLNDLEPKNPVFVPEEDLSASQMGLGYAAGGSGTITGLEECRKFLEKTVDLLWERIETKLRVFNRESVALACFRANEQLSQDARHWELTSRAMLAGHADQSDVRNVIGERKAKRAMASVVNRLILEISQYCGNIDSARLINEADRRALMADAASLLECAQHRDAIANGFMEAKVDIKPNGDVWVEESFYREVMVKYLSHHADKRISEDANSYDAYFDQEERSVTQPLSEHAQRLNQCFRAEFGVDLTGLLDIGEELAKDAIAKQQNCVFFRKFTWLVFLRDRCGVELGTASRLLERLSLPFRASWAADLPLGCKMDDVMPWRNRRRLSLLQRPLVQIEANPKRWMTFVTWFRTSVRHVAANIEAGYFPETHFKSAEMKKYVGDQANRKGHEFAKKVGDEFASKMNVRMEVEMHGLGAAKQSGLGDIDVLAWSSSSKIVYVIECKRLRMALNVREVIQRLEDFAGDIQKKDSLGRHLRRIAWLEQNPSSIARITGMSVGDFTLRPLLVTSAIVPMQFFQQMKFPTDQVVPFDDLPSLLNQ